ncbi:hypothetical protein ACFX13_016824 [Malus domestica]
MVKAAAKKAKLAKVAVKNGKAVAKENMVKVAAQVDKVVVKNGKEDAKVVVKGDRVVVKNGKGDAKVVVKNGKEDAKVVVKNGKVEAKAGKEKKGKSRSRVAACSDGLHDQFVE